MESNFNYKKYSLENLENWLYDAMSAGDATPQEIYDVIVNVVKDNYYVYKKQASEAYELLTLLNNNPFAEEVKETARLWDYEPTMPPWGHSDMEALRYTESEMDAMCEKAASDDEKNKCREYNLREAEYYNKRAELDAESEAIRAAGGYEWTPEIKQDKVVKWQLPVEIDGSSGEYFVTFPDDLLEAANLIEGDQVEWIDNGDGSYTLKKITKQLGMDEC